MNLMSAGIREIVIVVNKSDHKSFYKQLGDGGDLGMNISYAFQLKAGGLPHAIYSAKKFLFDRNSIVILGDTYFEPKYFKNIFESNLGNVSNFGAHILLSKVYDGRKYGTVRIENKKIIELIEKPLHKSLLKKDVIMNGLYIFDINLISYIEKLVPSKRGELEMVDLLECYRKSDKLDFTILSKKFRFYDFGNSQDFFNSTKHLFKNKSKVLAPHFISLLNNWITEHEYKKMVNNFPPSYYKEFCSGLLQVHNRYKS